MSKINETNYPRRTQASYEDTDMLVIQKAGGNTYTTRIEDLREDCQETLAPALNTMRENLATIEGSTASKAYAKGDYLVFGGRLCKAKTSIAVNATLILDTNIELAPVGDELSSISSDLSDQIKIVYHRFGNTGIVAANTTKEMTETLPALSGYTGVALIPLDSGDDQFCWCSCRINNGTMLIRVRNASSSNDSGNPEVNIVYVKNT